MRKIVVALILLAVVVSILDRVVVTGVQNEVARQIAAKYDLDDEPKVEIKGIPFLTQAVSGTYDEIDISMGPMTRGGVHLTSADARLTGVHAKLNDLLASNAEITADKVTGTVVISRQSLAARAPDGFTVEGDGDRLSVSGSVVVHNIKVPITADMKIGIVRGGVRLTPENVKAAGQEVPDLARRIGWTVPVKNLPLNMKITKVTTSGGGLAVEASATDVPLKG
jgi:hypothetical protein